MLPLFLPLYAANQNIKKIYINIFRNLRVCITILAISVFFFGKRRVLTEYVSGQNIKNYRVTSYEYLFFFSAILLWSSSIKATANGQQLLTILFFLLIVFFFSTFFQCFQCFSLFMHF